MAQSRSVLQADNLAVGTGKAVNTNGAVRIGVVIPCRGDAQLLPKCLLSLSDFVAAGDRVVVVNADHSPATTAAATGAGVEVINSDKPDRGKVVAAGIAHLLGIASNAPDVVLIAHADMEFAPESRKVMILAIGSNARWHWGALGHHISSPLWRFRVVEAGNRLRASRFQTPYGDQAMFFGVDALETSGGFPQQNTMEDFELALRLKAIVPPLYINYPVRISDRHWRRGVSHASARNWFTAINYLMSRTELRVAGRVTTTVHRPVGI